MNPATVELIQETPLYQAMVNVGYFPIWGDDGFGSEWSLRWSIPYAPLPFRIRQLNEKSSNPRVIQEPYEDCDLHRALMNTGYRIIREEYRIRGKDTGKKIDYYAPESKNEFPAWMIENPLQGAYKVGGGGRIYPAEVYEMYPYTCSYSRF